MQRILPIFILTVCSISISPLVLALPIIAHQRQTRTSEVQAMIHLDPSGSPFAGKPAKTWFTLTRQNGEMISPADCDCHLAAFNARNHAIAEYFPLVAVPVKGHQKSDQAIQTTITFPQPGNYTVVLSGKSTDQSFAPFELNFPVRVRP